MKKILLLLLLLTGTAGAAYYYMGFSSDPGLKDEYYADYLPADTLATVNLLDLKGLSGTFPDSPPGKLFAKPVVAEIMTELGAKEGDIQSYNDLYDGLAAVLTNPAFHQIFGDDAVIGLLSPDLARLRTAPEQEIQDSILAFGSSASAASIDRLARIIMGRDVAKETVNELDMTRIRLDENEVIYGYTKDGVVILAYSTDRIVAAIKQKTAGNSLGDSDSFIAAAKFWKESADDHCFAQSYLNLIRFRTFLSTSKKTKFQEADSYLQGFKSLGGVLTDRRGDLCLITKAEYSLDALHEQVQRQYQSLADKNLSLSLLTENTLAYYWLSTLELLSAGTKYKAAKAMIEKELGLSSEQVMQALGPQAGIILNDVINTGLFPLPRLVLFTQVRDQQTARQIIDRLRSMIDERGFAEEQTTTVSGHTVYYWNLLPPEEAHPAIVLTENMLYIANGEESLKALLDIQQAQSELSEPVTDLLDIEPAEQLKAADYFAFVLRPTLLAAEIQESADWFSGILAASGNVSSARLQEELLKLMQSVEVVAGYGNFDRDYVHSTLLFKPVSTVNVKQKKK